VSLGQAPHLCQAEVEKLCSELSRYLVGHVGYRLFQRVLGGGHQAVLLGQHFGASLHRLGQPSDGMSMSSVQRCQ
jgi:hypothetical protein